MEREVDPKVLAVIEEKRLSGPRLSPADIISKMGVFDARDKPFESAWIASGDSVIVTIWGEYVHVGTNGRWFYLESLNAELRAGGSARTPAQMERAKFRLTLLKRSFDEKRSFRAVLQTNRIAIDEAESNKSAKISTRVRDDEEWHVASWLPDAQTAVLVRGPQDWEPSAEELKAAARRYQVPAGGQTGTGAGEAAQVPGDQERDLDGAAKAYVIKHFSSYGYQAEDLSSQGLGYDVEVKDKKGATLLRVCVRGAGVGSPIRALAPGEVASSTGEKLWRLLVVSDPLSGVAQHRIYKASELPQVLPGA
jgi:hypothetical protein